jgi:hypothetical protein
MRARSHARKHTHTRASITAGAWWMCVCVSVWWIGYSPQTRTEAFDGFHIARSHIIYSY